MTNAAAAALATAATAPVPDGCPSVPSAQIHGSQLHLTWRQLGAACVHQECSGDALPRASGAILPSYAGIAAQQLTQQPSSTRMELLLYSLGPTPSVRAAAPCAFHYQMPDVGTYSLVVAVTAVYC